MKEKKKRAYGQRVHDVEFASFSPFVLSLTGGLGREATCVYKRLSSQLANKWQQPYSKILYWVRTTLSFALLRASIRCLREARSTCGKAARIRWMSFVLRPCSAIIHCDCSSTKNECCHKPPFL